MLTIGHNDSFERKYMGKFREIASRYGEVVKYDYDRAGRDIGLHLTRKSSTGEEKLTSSFCWFQMKGVMESSLDKSSFDSLSELCLRLKVSHLQYWYLQPLPTYLAIYIECDDKFFILNLKEYVSEKWGNNIFSLSSKTVTVVIPKQSELDEQAFYLILKKGTIDEWKNILQADEESAKLIARDCNVIYAIGRGSAQGVEYRMTIKEWISKLRSEVYIYEIRQAEDKDNKKCIRTHWEFMADVSNNFTIMYPYLDFYRAEDSLDVDDIPYGDENSYPYQLELPDGDIVVGDEMAGEYVEYSLECRLNQLGDDLYRWILSLRDMGLIEIDESRTDDFIDVAPWHHRSV